jgi:hypothetical protein
MKSQTQLQLQSSEELSNFLKKFSPISGSLLIEIEDGYIKAKTHTPERSVVKSSKTELSRMFDTESTSSQSEPVKFGVYSVDRLLKSFSHFGDGNIEFVLDEEKTAEGTVGTDITLKNDSLNINYQCASLRLFTHITDEMMDRIADHESAQTNFVLTKELQARLASLSNLDPDHKLITFNIKNGIVKASGKSFNLNLLNIDDTSADVTISVYKSQFAYLDKEDTMVYVNEDRLIFHSIESETKMIIGKAD